MIGMYIKEGQSWFTLKFFVGMENDFFKANLISSSTQKTASKLILRKENTFLSLKTFLYKLG